MRRYLMPLMLVAALLLGGCAAGQGANMRDMQATKAPTTDQDSGAPGGFNRARRRLRAPTPPPCLRAPPPPPTVDGCARCMVQYMRVNMRTGRRARPFAARRRALDF